MSHDEAAWQWRDAMFTEVPDGPLRARPLREINGQFHPIITVATRTEEGHLCVMEGVNRAWGVKHCEAVWADRMWVCGFMPDHDGPHLASTYELIEGHGVRILSVSTKRRVTELPKERSI